MGWDGWTQPSEIKACTGLGNGEQIVWQGTCSTNKWNLSCYSPRVQAVLFGFRWFVRRRGGSTTAAVRLDTVADESRKKKADCVARSPSRLCSRDGKICCYGDALNMIFLLAFVLCFLLFVFHISFLYFLIFSLHSGTFIFFLSLLCSSHLLLSASTYFIVRVLYFGVIWIPCFYSISNFP